MRLIGALLVFGGSYAAGADSGLLGFVESWAIIGAGVMAGGIVGIFSSLPRFIARTNALTQEDVVAMDDGDAEQMLEGHMGLYAWSFALIGGLLGFLIATAIV